MVLLLIVQNSIGQNEASTITDFHLKLPDRENLMKYKISRIEATDFYSQKESELSEIWRVDSCGHIIKYILLFDNDTTQVFTKFQYDKNTLSKVIEADIWAPDIMTDSIITTHIYNENEKYIGSFTTGRFKYSKKRYYNGDSFYDVKIDSNEENGLVVFDTTYYNKFGNPIREVNSNTCFFTFWKYNNQEQLIQKTMVYKTDTTNIHDRYTLFYKNGKIISEFRDGSVGLSFGYKYYYDKRGFVNKVESSDPKTGEYTLDRIYKYY